MPSIIQSAIDPRFFLLREEPDDHQLRHEVFTTPTVVSGFCVAETVGDVVEKRLPTALPDGNAAPQAIKPVGGYWVRPIVTRKMGCQPSVGIGLDPGKETFELLQTLVIA